MKYIIENSFETWMTAIFEMFERKQFQAILYFSSEYSESLFDEKFFVLGDKQKAERVWNGLIKKVGKHKAQDFFNIWLSEKIESIRAATNLIISIFQGNNQLNNFGNEDVIIFSKTLKQVSRERHRMKAFIRFSKDSNQQYFAIIEPDFNVLPLIVPFFKNRYQDQEWLIYDVKRKYGMLYDKKIIQEVNLIEPDKKSIDIQGNTIDLDEQDEFFMELWQKYFNSTNIKERKNLKLHIQHVPKRYWKYLPEKWNELK